MARTTLSDDDYHGGRVIPDKPKQLRYPCFAESCPMPGTLFPGAGVGGTGDQRGTCAWHHGVVSSEIPKITRVLLDWQCVAYEVREARRSLTNPDIATDVVVLREHFDAAWARMQPLVVGAWDDQLQPKPAESFGDWAKRLEAFIGARVVEVRNTHRPTARSARAHAFAEVAPA